MYFPTMILILSLHHTSPTPSVDNLVLVRVKNKTADHHEEYVIKYKDLDNVSNNNEYGKKYKELFPDVPFKGLGGI